MSPIDPAACRDFLEVIDERHGTKSVVITAQLPVIAWHGIFEDATITDAVLDRIVHSAYRLEVKGLSMRRTDTADNNALPDSGDDNVT
jgi:DNA replication protein DnaC